MNLDSLLRRSRKDSQTPSVPGCKTKAQRTSCFHPDPWAQEDSGGSRKPAWHLLLEPELGDRQRQPEWWERCYLPPTSASSERRGRRQRSPRPLPPPSLCSSLPPSPPLHRATPSCCRPARGPSVLLLRSWVAVLLRTAESSLSGWFSLGFVPTAERGEVRLCDRNTGSSEMLGPALTAR